MRDEPVRLTRIYTRGGDGGETSLGDGSRTSKLDPLVRAYGEVDELNSLLGWAQVVGGRPAARADPERALRPRRRPLRALRRGRRPASRRSGARSTGSRRTATRRTRRCPELRSFVLPGGSEAAARLHVARAVCRRAEREVLAAGRIAAGQPAGGRLPEPALGPAVRPRAGRERGWRRSRSGFPAASAEVRGCSAGAVRRVLSR